jgi:preprotein translocase subunit YajC
VNGGGSIIILVALFAVLWLVLIRPQKAKQQRQQHLLSSVEPGDEVLTVGGLYGIVQAIDEDNDLIVEVAEGIHVRIARRAIATVVKPDEDEDEEATDDHAEDEHAEDNGAPELTSPHAEVTDEDAGLEATQRRLFGRRN